MVLCYYTHTLRKLGRILLKQWAKMESGALGFFCLQTASLPHITSCKYRMVVALVDLLFVKSFSNVKNWILAASIMYGNNSLSFHLPRFYSIQSPWDTAWPMRAFLTHSGNIAYLNGLRGWAALLVCCHHPELGAHQSASNIFERAYGYRLRYQAIFHTASTWYIVP